MINLAISFGNSRHLVDDWSHLSQIAVIVGPVDIGAQVIERVDLRRRFPHRVIVGHQTTERFQVRMVGLAIVSNDTHIVDHAALAEGFAGRLWSCGHLPPKVASYLARQAAQ